MIEEASSTDQSALGWRLKAGAVIFMLSIILPVMGVPLVANLDLSGTITTTVSATLLISAEVLGVLVVAVMGKPGYLYIKNRVFSFLHPYLPLQKVSQTRYQIGLVLFCVPLIFGFLSPYFYDLIPGFAQNPFYYAVGGDVLFLMSFFVLGGDFWDKIRALFVYTDKVCSSNK